jgi:hypothetical protein
MRLQPIDGFVGFLDAQHREVGTRQVMHFEWGAGPGACSVRILNDRRFDLTELPSPASYVAIDADNGEHMFTLPMIARPKHGGQLLVGPSY